MANIIDISFFYGELEIPQKTEDSVILSVNRFIQTYESKFLNELFGYQLYKDFIDNQDASKYIDLVEGKEYTYQERLRKYQGLKIEIVPAVGLSYIDLLEGRNFAKYASPIANYIYIQYMKYTYSVSTSTGEKIVDAQNAKEASVGHKIITAWNQMVEWNNEVARFLIANKSDYFEWTIDSQRKWYLLQKMNLLF